MTVKTKAKTAKKKKPSPKANAYRAGRPKKYAEELSQFPIKLTPTVRKALDDQWEAEKSGRDDQFSRSDLILEVLADWLGVPLKRTA